MTRLQPVDEAFVADLRARGTEPSEATVTSVYLCAEAGITYRQCDWWTRMNYLTIVPAALGNPGRPGWQRRFPVTEVAVAALMKRLLDAGLALPQAHDAARAHVADPDELVILGPGLALIITDEDDDDEPAAAGAR